MTNEKILALADKVELLPGYTAMDLGADRLVSGKDRKLAPKTRRVILINAKHRDLVAKALRWYARYAALQVQVKLEHLKPEREHGKDL